MVNGRLLPILAGITLLSCGTYGERRDRPFNYPGNRISLAMERKSVQDFFDRHDLGLRVNQTRQVAPYRIFLHRFKATESQIRRIVEILRLDSVTQRDFYDIHMSEFSNADFRVHCPMGRRYLKDPDILFYRAERDNETARRELKVTKVYLYFNRRTGEACFQVYHGWG